MRHYLFLWGYFKKEVTLFFWSSGAILTSIIFSLSMFTLFRFTLNTASLPIHLVLWVTHLLSVTFLLLQSQEWEREEKVYRVFSLSGLDLNIIFLGKTISLVIVMLCLWFVEVLIWFLFFDVSLIGVTLDQFIYLFILTGFLSSLALSVSGVQASALAVHSDFPIVMLLIIFLPLNLPVSVASSKLIMLGVKHTSTISSSQLISLIVAFTLFYTGLGVLLFSKLLEE